MFDSMLSYRASIKMSQDFRLYIQTIEPVIAFIEPELIPIHEIKSFKQFYEYLIAKVLFKTGKWNIVYQNNPRFDVIRSNISNNLIGGAGMRYLDNIILKHTEIPETKEDEVITLEVKGNLLFVRYSNYSPYRKNEIRGF